MSTTTTLLLGGAAMAVLLLLVALARVVVLAGRLRREVALTQQAVVAVEQQVEDLQTQLRRLRAGRPDTGVHEGLVVTDEGVLASVPTGAPADDQPPARAVPDRLVLSATLGEPLVRVAAFGHGVRRALGPASRNRIRLAMRQEVRRSRKQRRRDRKAAYRAMQMQGGIAGRVPGEAS